MHLCSLRRPEVKAVFARLRHFIGFGEYFGFASVLYMKVAADGFEPTTKGL